MLKSLNALATSVSLAGERARTPPRAQGLRSGTTSTGNRHNRTPAWAAFLAAGSERLRARGISLAIAALVFLALAVAGAANIGALFLGFAAIGITGMLVPISGRQERKATQSVGESAAVTVDGRIAAFADALDDPVILLDHRGVVVHRNRNATQQFPSVRAGNPVSFAIRTPAVVAALDAALKTGVAQEADLHLKVPTERWYRVRIAPIVEPGSAGAHPMVMTLTNLTEQKRIDAMRADFIANVSHELRTPLTSLLGFIDTLLGPAARDAAAREKFLGIMRGQAVRMSKLIDDLLSLSRIEMRQHLRPTETVNLALLLGEVAEGLQNQANEAGIAVQLRAADGATVTGDRDELYQVFENLLENALKYGAGPIEIELSPAENRAGFAYAITVTDHGPGVPAQHVPRLTERFYRVDVDASRRKKGTGLGLAIVKHIVQRHHGRLSIRSTEGEGTRVEVLLRK